MPTPPSTDPVAIPDYLRETYWWAYLHPTGVRFFERQWVVNLILWGNYQRLRDGALAELGPAVNGRLLQVACVYGDFTPRLVGRLAASAHLDVVDVAPIQLRNLDAKLGSDPRVHLALQDSSHLAAADASYEVCIVFFLLHEQPLTVAKATLAEALRVVKPGGKLLVVDYHGPHRANPLRYVMQPLLRKLEPFAEALWDAEVADWLPAAPAVAKIEKTTYCGGLYQKVVITRAAG